jgi:hypothetical protein
LGLSFLGSNSRQTYGQTDRKNKFDRAIHDHSLLICVNSNALIDFVDIHSSTRNGLSRQRINSESHR